MGDAEGALTGLEPALREVRELGDPGGEAEILRQRAVALTLLPDTDWEATAADFEAPISIFERLETRPYLARALQDYRFALQTARRPAEAQDEAPTSREGFGRTRRGVAA